MGWTGEEMTILEKKAYDLYHKNFKPKVTYTPFSTVGFFHFAPIEERDYYIQSALYELRTEKLKKIKRKINDNSTK
jgi:hypothetical protein